jgi:hypothetical protein
VPIAIEGVNRLRGSNLTGTTSLLQGYISYQIRDKMGGGKNQGFQKGGRKIRGEKKEEVEKRGGKRKKCKNVKI